MPLAIDESSPPITYGTFDPNTTDSFTPPDAAMILCLWAGNSDTNTDPPEPIISSSPSQTWTRNVWDHRTSGSPVQDGHAAIWNCKFTLSPGATAASVNISSSALENALLALVLTGHDTAAPIGVTGGGRQAGGAVLYATYTATITGGQGFLVVCDWGATDSSLWTPGPGCTMLHQGTISGQISWAMMRRSEADGIDGLDTTLELDGLTSGGQYHYGYVEVVSAEAGAAAALSSVAQSMKEPDEPLW